MTTKPGILLLAHRFAPYSRIGSYRWVRLSCRLARLGHPVHVLSVNWPFMEDMAWLREAEEPGVQIHRTPSGYPQWLKYFQWPAPLDRGFGQGVRYLARQFPAYDEAALWKKHLVRAARRLGRQQRIDCIVATGGPFTTMAHALAVKEEIPDASLILDYRDPWFLSVEEAKASGWGDAYEAGLRHAAAVVGVTDEMTGLLRSHVEAPQGRFETIENGIDLEYLRDLSRQDRPHPDYQTDFVHAGSLFAGRHLPLLPFFNWMRQRRQQGAPVTLRLIGRMDRELPRHCRDLVTCGDVMLVPAMTQNEAFREVLSARIALHLNAPQTNTTQVSTKLLEYAGLGRPSLSLNYGGAVEALVKQAKLGWSLDASSPDLHKQLDEVLTCSTDTFAPHIEQYGFERLAQRYSKLICSLSGQASMRSEDASSA